MEKWQSKWVWEKLQELVEMWSKLYKSTDTHLRFKGGKGIKHKMIYPNEFFQHTIMNPLPIFFWKKTFPCATLYQMLMKIISFSFSRRRTERRRRGGDRFGILRRETKRKLPKESNEEECRSTDRWPDKMTLFSNWNKWCRH